MGARERFVMTREYLHKELPTIRALLGTHGEEWKPAPVGKSGTSDPTAATAIRNVDELGDELRILREREVWLCGYIAFTLLVIAGVRKGFGKGYADILQQRYIDGLPWAEVAVDGQPVNRRTGQRMANVAFDWLDSVGMADVAGGRYEV